jgi:hypothetical protein
LLSDACAGMLSSTQIARLVQTYLAEPGASIDRKAALVGVRRNELLRAACGTISRTTRLRLLAYFAVAPTGRAAYRPTAAAGPHRQRKHGFT